MSGSSAPAVDPEEFLGVEAEEVFTELVNVAFGRAAVPLSELLETFVVLQVPSIGCVHSESLRGVLPGLVRTDGRLMVVQQTFMTGLEGQALLCFDSDTRSMIEELVGEDGEAAFHAGLLEVSNIVLGSCVGQLANLLEVSTRYSPPVLVLDNGEVSDLPLPSPDTFSKAVLVQTGFQLEDKKGNFCLLLLLPDSTLEWLRRTLQRMWSDL